MLIVITVIVIILLDKTLKSNVRIKSNKEQKNKHKNGTRENKKMIIRRKRIITIMTILRAMIKKIRKIIRMIRTIVKQMKQIIR